MAIRNSVAITLAVALLVSPACSADRANATATNTTATAATAATTTTTTETRSDDAMPGPILTSGTRAIELAARPVRVPLVARDRERRGVLKSRARSASSLHVVIRGLRAEEPPGVLYHAYLDLPEGTEPANDDARHIGIINFFAATPPAPDDPERASHTFDITEAVHALAAKGMLADETSITIRPAGTPAAKASIRRIEIVEQ